MGATVVVATNNAGKARELRALLDGPGCGIGLGPGGPGCGIGLGPGGPGNGLGPGGSSLVLDVLSLGDAGVSIDPEETGGAFAENALIKARAASEAIARSARAGLPPVLADAIGAGRLFVLADDSGLCVDHLGGAPGVRSARYAGAGADDAARSAKLLRALAGVPGPMRGAHFECSAALICPDGSVCMCEGRCDGSILPEPRGQGGFGYDPVFCVDGLGRSMAELEFEEKNRVSHRGKAARAAARAIAEWLASHSPTKDNLPSGC